MQLSEMKEIILPKNENTTKFNQVLKETMSDEVFMQDLTLILFIEMVRLTSQRGKEAKRTEAHQGYHKYGATV